MSELKSLIIVIAVIGLGASLLGNFYIGMYADSGHNATSVETLKTTSQAHYNSIIANSTEILETQQQQQETNIFTVANVFLSTGYSVVALIISTPSTINAMMTDIILILSPVAIPSEFIALINIIIVITVVFALARFLSGRFSS